MNDGVVEMWIGVLMGSLWDEVQDEVNRTRSMVGEASTVALRAFFSILLYA